MLKRGVRKKQNKLIFISLMLLLVFCPLSFTSQAENYWGISRDTYTYSQVSERTRYDIEGSGGVEYSNTTTEEVMIWDVVSNENIITFRTTKWVTFLSYIYCESKECYDEFLEALEYDDETESVKATYVYNDTEQKVGFVDPRNNEFLGFEANIPINPIDLPMPMGTWDYIGCLFLPVLSPSLSFETNYTVYELIYTDFELEFQNSFRMQRKKFEGYSYNYEYTFFIEIVDFPGKKIFNKALFQYNNQGVLYNYERKNEEYREVNGKYKLYWNHEMTYTIDEIDEELAVSLQWIFGFVGLVFIAISYRIYLSKR